MMCLITFCETPTYYFNACIPECLCHIIKLNKGYVAISQFARIYVTNINVLQHKTFYIEKTLVMLHCDDHGLHYN